MEIVNNGSGHKKNGGYNKIESWSDEVTKGIADRYYDIIKLLGEDPEREGLSRTFPRGVRGTPPSASKGLVTPCRASA